MTNTVRKDCCVYFEPRANREFPAEFTELARVKHAQLKQIDKILAAHCRPNNSPTFNGILRVYLIFICEGFSHPTFLQLCPHVPATRLVSHWVKKRGLRRRFRPKASGENCKLTIKTAGA